MRKIVFFLFLLMMFTFFLGCTLREIQLNLPGSKLDEEPLEGKVMTLELIGGGVDGAGVPNIYIKQE